MDHATKDRLEKLSELNDYDARARLAREDERTRAMETPTRSDILDSSDPRCVLRAWLNDGDMGGWWSADEDAFLVAIRDELEYALNPEEVDSAMEAITIEEVGVDD